MHVIYTGERVRLRPFASFEEYNSVTAEDYAQPDPYRGPRWWPEPDRSERFKLRGMIGPEAYSNYAIEELECGTVVGTEGHSPITSGQIWANLGTYLLPEWRGKGLGIEAKQLMLCLLFENYPLQVVQASTIEHHRRARQSLEACGMQLFGQLRGIERVDDVVYDEVQYRIFREQWEQLPIRDRVQRG
jgi:RimJ/RimL family protein N-acetyltransferase